ncbi:MAG TPA: Hpt domain-containing protein [Longimicrobium sp.]|jgi:HPt (histidine-containing phosphotransfer) domain-containing protein|uniref:Hpt domain-containing protein n=1 Tax=Longimicrobium sp. TaxID=2029185 RepID=UPI002EDA21F1
MSQPLREYFGLEAAEFLDQMDGLLAGDQRPDAMRFFRLARGVRGSAQLAGADAIAEVAERLEDGARALRDGILVWGPDVRDRARATAADLRAFVERHGAGWGAEDDQRARAAADRWSDVRGGRRRNDSPGGANELFPFVQRELMGVVAEMDRVLGELAAHPAERDPLRVVLRRMRPVRGVAGMDVLAPVLEVLEGIEDASHEILGRVSGVLPSELALLSAARDALRAAGGVLATGTAPAESSAELQAFRELRDQADQTAGAEGGAEVIPISRLFVDGGTLNLVSSPLAPMPAEDGSATPEVEQFLRIEGTGFLDRAEASLASLPARPRRFTRTAREVAELAASVRELASTYAMAPMAAAAELAATRLSAAATPDEAREALRVLRIALSGVAPHPEPAPAAAPSISTAPPEPGPVASEPSALEAEDGVVPVETILYAPDAALREALAMRERVETLARATPGTPLGEALDELFGLVQVAAGAS